MWYASGFSYMCIKAKIKVLSTRQMEKIYFWANFQNQPILDTRDQFWWDPQGTQKMVNKFFCSN